MTKFHRYMAVPQMGNPLYFRFRWMARFVAWFTGWTFIDTNDQGTTATIDGPTGCSPILIALVVLALGVLAWAVV